MKFKRRLSFFIVGLIGCLISEKAFSQQSTLYRRQILNSGFSTEGHVVKVAFMDVDGTLLISGKDIKGVMILPFVPERIAELNQAGYLVMIVSNQSQAKDENSIKLADKSLYSVTQLIQSKNPKAVIHAIDFSDRDSHYSKPNTGMAENIENTLAQQDLKIDWSKSLMVGDAAYAKNETRPDGRAGYNHGNADRLFAKNLKIAFYEPNDFFGWRCHGINTFNSGLQVNQYLKKHLQRCSVLKLN